MFRCVFKGFESILENWISLIEESQWLKAHDELERIGIGYFCPSEERKLSRRRTTRFNADIYVCSANWFAGFIRNLGNNGRDLSRW